MNLDNDARYADGTRSLTFVGATACEPRFLARVRAAVIAFALAVAAEPPSHRRYGLAEQAKRRKYAAACLNKLSPELVVHFGLAVATAGVHDGKPDSAIRARVEEVWDAFCDARSFCST